MQNRPTPAEAAHGLGRQLDAQGRLVRWPTRLKLRQLVASYLVAKFEQGRRYSEPEVNAILDAWHLFNDPAILRRTMYDLGYLERTPDGSAYWLSEDPPES